MIVSLNEQAFLFITTILAGGAIGFLYDVIRIIRKIVNHSNILIQLEDGIYWIAVAFLMFFLMLHKNYGEIRFFSVYGAFMGMLIYFLTVSRIVNLVSDAVIYAIKYVILLFLRIVFTPFRLIFILFRKPVIKTRNLCKKKAAKLLHLGKLCVRINKKRAVRNARIILKKK